jgi:deoxyribonuclease-4
MLGANVSTVGGLHTGFAWGDEWDCEAIQIYLTGSRMWYVPHLEEGEEEKFKETWDKSNVREVVSHIPFLVNLASPDSALFDKSVTRLEKEILRAQELDVNYVVLHPGSYTTSTRAEGIESTIEGLKRVLHAVDSVNIAVETMAGQGTQLGAEFWELEKIIAEVDHPNIGVCFDAGHVFMAGYDITKDYAGVMSEFDERIGLEKIKVVHLNDSKKELDSHIDRHANIGEGKMGLEVFREIMNDKSFKDTPMVLEIPDSNEKTKDNIELLREMVD